MEVPRADEFFYREAEKLINKTYRRYADMYAGLGTETYLFMTLLDIAVAHKKLQAEADRAPVADTLEALLADIDKELAQSEGKATEQA